MCLGHWRGSLNVICSSTGEEANDEKDLIRKMHKVSGFPKGFRMPGHWGQLVPYRWISTCMEGMGQSNCIHLKVA